MGHIKNKPTCEQTIKLTYKNICMSTIMYASQRVCALDIGNMDGNNLKD